MSGDGAQTNQRPTIGRRLVALALAIAFVALSLAVKLVPFWAMAMMGPASKVARSLGSGAIALGLTAGVTWLAGRFWPALALPGLTLHPGARRDVGLAGLGVLLGGLLFGSVYGAARLTDGVEVVWLGLPAATLAKMMLVGFVATVLNACWEEYAFRGWPFAVCAQAFGPHAVALGLGTIFGLAHMLNSNWIWQASVSTALAGFLLGYAMLAATRISLPMGLHVGWNYTQSLLSSRRYWRWTPSASVLRSGGIYGLEASLAGMLITGSAALTALLLYRRSSRSLS